MVQPISLRDLDPKALETLKREGSTTFSIPEYWYDLFLPGLYRRRIMQVSVSVPMVGGAFASSHMLLGVTAAKFRKGATTGDASDNFVSVTTSEQVVLSRAQDDTGLFMPDLRDPKWLPFERLGAISDWSLEIPAAHSAFERESISDVVLTIRYTAKVGESTHRDAVRDALDGKLFNNTSPALGRWLAFSVKRDFADALHTFLNPDAEAATQILALPFTSAHFPLPLRHGVMAEVAVLFAWNATAGWTTSNSLFLELTADSSSIADTFDLDPSSTFGNHPYDSQALSSSQSLATTLTFTAEETTGGDGGVDQIPAAYRVGGSEDPKRLNADALDDIIVLIRLVAGS